MRKFFALLLALPLLAAAQGEYDYHYWFDSQLDGPLSASGRSNTPTLTLSPDVSSLREGIHTFNISVADPSGGGVSSIRSNYFLRLPLAGSQTYSVQTLVDGQPYRTDRVTSTGMTLHYDLDATALPYGLHSLSLAVINESGAVSSFHESMFFRVPTDAENSAMVLHYMIDGKEAGTAPLSGGSAMLQLDLVSIPCGVHELTVYASDGRELTTNFASRLFVKTPGPIESYTYWLNGDYSSAKSVKLAEPKADLRVIDMLAVDAVPFRSKMFACVPDAATGNLTLYARNELSVAFFSHGYEAVAMDSRSYTDQRVSRTVDASEIHSFKQAANASIAIDRPLDNEIKWFKYDVEPGELFLISTDRPCSLDVFNPAGVKVYSVTGVASTTVGKIEAAETGTYYLAVHDFAPSVSTVQMNYTLLSRHAIASVTPDHTANGSTLFVDLYGNGFDELKNVTLNIAGSSIPSSYVSARDKYNAFARFDLDSLSVPTGVYNVVAHYTDSITNKSENVVLDKGITLEAPEVVNITATIEPSYRASSPYEVYIKITNNSNIPCSFVPVNLAITESQRGRAIIFKDFYPHRLSTDLTNSLFKGVSHTDNLLNSHVGGFLFPTIVPYIGAHETITLTIGINSFSHERVRMYAWAGEPWSEEIKRICEPDYQFTSQDFEQTNTLSMTKIVIMQFATLMKSQGLIDDSGEPTDRRYGPRKANMSTWGDDLGNAVHRLINKPNYSGTAKNLAIANGKALGGIHNGLRLNNLNACMEAYGIDPSDETFGSLGEYGNDLKQNMPNPGEIAATAMGFEDDYSYVQGYMNNCPTCNNPRPDPVDVDCMQSGDPNDITGYTSPSGSRYIGQNIKRVGYTIEFENDPQIANASAMTIDITNTLDGQVFDLSSLIPDQLRISNKTIELPHKHNFVATIDMRPEINTVAELSFNYNAEDGKMRWHLTSLDPMTMEPTDYFEQGILPVNDSISHRGEGMISYTIGLKPGLADGTKLRNQASIVFDTNAPIETPVWENIIDYTLPTAQVAVATADNKEFAFTFSGSDSGAGIWMYALYLRYPGTDEWLLLRDGIEQADFSYEAPEALPAGTMFAVLATDGAGNEQDSAFMRLQPGDVDRSGIVDANDVLALSAYYMGKPVNIALSVSDVNSDGLIDSQDVLAIARIYLQKYPTKKQQRTRKYSTK